MGLGCTAAATTSPCPQLSRLRSTQSPSLGGYYPRGSIWLLAGSAGSRAGRVWSSLLALSCGNLSVGSSGSLVLLHAFFFFSTNLLIRSWSMRALRTLLGIALHEAFLLLCSKEGLSANLTITVARGKKELIGFLVARWSLLVSADRIIYSANCSGSDYLQ